MQFTVYSCDILLRWPYQRTNVLPTCDKLVPRIERLARFHVKGT